MPNQIQCCVQILAWSLMRALLAPTSVDSGGTYAHSYLRKTKGPFFAHNIHPLSSGTFPQLTPISGTLWWPLFPFFYLIFVGLGKYTCTYFTTTLEGPYLICNVLRALSPFLGRPLKALSYTPLFLISPEASEKHPISREIGLKQPLFRFLLGKSPPRQTARKYPLSRENGNAHAAPLNIRVGAGARCSCRSAQTIITGGSWSVSHIPSQQVAGSWSILVSHFSMMTLHLVPDR